MDSTTRWYACIFDIDVIIINQLYIYIYIHIVHVQSKEICFLWLFRFVHLSSQTSHPANSKVSRMIDKDRVILVSQPSKDPLQPEGRVLVKHPNVPVDSLDRI